MKRTSTIIFALLLCAGARGGSCADYAGTGAAVFLKLPADPRAAAMGEAVGAGLPGPMALFQNPAALAGSRLAAGFSHALLMEDISYDAICAAAPAGDGALAVGAQYLRYGAVDSVDNTGAPAGSLSPKDAAFSAGYGLFLDDGISLGVAAKYISSRLSRTAAAAALDFGLMIKDDKVAVSFSGQNIGKGLKYGSEESPLAATYRLGMSGPIRKNLLWAADFNFPKDGARWVAVGAEYAFEMKAATAYGRAGYNTSAWDTKGLNGISAGFGLDYRGLTLDYALRTMGVLGSTHHLGLGYRFGRERVED